jgi:hypothetical protein
MAAQRMKIAQLNEARLAKVRRLEEKLGTYLVALEPQYSLAKLSKEHLKQVEALEKELGVVLLAYERD